MTETGGGIEISGAGDILQVGNNDLRGTRTNQMRCTATNCVWCTHVRCGMNCELVWTVMYEYGFHCPAYIINVQLKV